MNLWFKEFTVGSIMQKVFKSLEEHKEGAIEMEQDCHLNPKNIEVDIV